MHLSESRHLLASGRVRAALALGVLVAPLGVNTMAYWSDTEVIRAGAVVAGDLDLKVNGGDGPLAGGLSVSGLNPGESKAAIYTLSNASRGANAAMQVTITSTSVDSGIPGTTAALSAKITNATTTDGSTCAGPSIHSATSFNGPLLVATPLELAPGTNRVVCVQATAASSAPRGGSAQIAMTFAATLKNPN